jgi:hypothetical protein
MLLTLTIQLPRNGSICDFIAVSSTQTVRRRWQAPVQLVFFDSILCWSLCIKQKAIYKGLWRIKYCQLKSFELLLIYFMFVFTRVFIMCYVKTENKERRAHERYRNLSSLYRH